MRILDIKGREILDSRGNPTVEVDVVARRRRARARGRAVGRVDRRTRSARAARRRPKTRISARACARRSRHVNGEIADALRQRELSQRELDRPLIGLDGTPNKGRLGANALLGVSMAALKADAMRAGKQRSTRTSPHLRGQHRRLSAAGADDEHPQRRRARRFERRLPGVHGDAARRAVVQRRAAHRRRDLSRAARPSEEARACRPASATKAASRRTCSRIAKRSKSCSKQSARPAIEPAPTSTSRSTSRRASSGLAMAGRYEFKKSGEPARDSEGMVALYVDWCRQYPIISIEDGCAEGDWRGWAMLTKELGASRAAGRRRCVRHQPGDPRARHHRRRRQRAARQAQSDRHRHRNARRDGDGVEGRLRERHLTPLGRNRRLDDRRSRRRHGRGPDQDRIRITQRPHRQVQPVAADRRGTRAGASTRGGPRSNNCSDGWPRDFRAQNWSVIIVSESRGPDSHW